MSYHSGHAGGCKSCSSELLDPYDFGDILFIQIVSPHLDLQVCRNHTVEMHSWGLLSQILQHREREIGKLAFIPRKFII